MNARVWTGIAVAVVAAGAAGWWWIGRGPAPVPELPAGKPPAPAGEGDEPSATPRAAERWVDVTVLDAETGKPVAEATVTAAVRTAPSVTFSSDDGLEMWTTEGSPGDESEEVDTDAAGRARAGPVGQGMVEMRVKAAGFRTPDAGIAVEGSRSRDDGLKAVVRLARAHAIEGHVLLPDGAPAVGASVTTTGQGLPLESSSSMCRTDAAGAFLAEPLEKGTYQVVAELEGERDLATRVVAAAGATGLVLRLAKSAGPRLVLRVLDPTGMPIPQASAEFDWQTPSESGGHARDVKDGVVTLQGDWSPEVDFTVFVTDAQGSDGVPLPLAPGVLRRLHLGEERVLRIPAEKTIEGRVLAADGKPVAGARVGATPLLGPASEAFAFGTPGHQDEVSTDDTGAFRIGRLGEGEHDVHVAPPPAFAAPADVRAAAGATGVAITLRAAAQAVLTVLDAQGSPLAGARVATTRDDVESEGDRVLLRIGAPGTQTTGVDGRATLPSLDPAFHYLLRVVPPSSRDDLASARLRHWTPASLSLRLERGFAISGFVRDTAGKAIGAARVTCSSKVEGGEKRLLNTRDGEFRFSGLRAGPVEITAMRESSGSTVSASVSAPAEGVVLTIDRGMPLTLRIEDWETYDRSSMTATLYDGKEGGCAVVVGGVATFEGLRGDATYALWVSPDSGGRLVYVPAVRAGGEVTAKLTAGKPITGRVVGPTGVVPEPVWIEDRGVGLWAGVKADGTFRFPSVPDGAWTVRAKDSKEAYEAHADVAAGGAVDLELKPK